MTGDREDAEKARAPMDEFMTGGDLTDLAAEELASALRSHGITLRDCYPDEDGVNVGFGGLCDVETLLTLVLSTDGPGTLYDRAASSCVTLTKLTQDAEATGTEPDMQAVSDAFRDGWTWTMHPELYGRVVGWHASVCMHPEDALQVASRLNEIRNGGVV